MRRRTPMTRLSVFFLLALALLALVGLPGSVVAHNKSLSFSIWQWDGKLLSVSFTAPARDVTLLPEVRRNADLSRVLADHVSAHLRLVQIDAPCKLEQAFAPATAHTGYVRVEGRFACFNETAEVTLDNHAFFNLARSHVHFARIAMAGTPLAQANEVLFTATQRSHIVRPDKGGVVNTKTDYSDTVQSYLWFGIEHILTGYDHLAFVLCLLLLARSRRQAVWLVSGFTIGHSLTLALAALGVVAPNNALIEALIGFSIALVAAETILARGGLMPRTGIILVGLFALASLWTSLTLRGLPLGAWAGLMLFSLCYGLAIGNRDDAQRFAPIMTLAFGLVHGFGFAGLLNDIGLPTDRLLTGLFSFNLGVELGQLLVMLPVLLLGPLVLAELPKLRLRWSDMLAAGLTAFGTYLFVARALI